jgi:hypothetical protein
MLKLSIELAPSDAPNVCIAGREIPATVTEGERIESLPAHFLSDELKNGFDMALRCDVGVHSAKLYRKM